MKTWAVLLGVVLVLLALEAESNPKGGRGGGRGWGRGGWRRRGWRSRGGGWGGSSWDSSPTDTDDNEWRAPESSENTNIDWSFEDLEKHIDDYFSRLSEITSSVKFENDPNTNTSRMTNVDEYLRNMSALLDSLDFDKPHKKNTGSSENDDDSFRSLSGTTESYDSGNLRISSTRSTKDLDNMPSQNNNGSSNDLENLPSQNSSTDSRKNVDELNRDPDKKSKGDWTWLTATAASHATSGSGSRAQKLSAPEFRSYHSRPGWRGVVSRHEEDARFKCSLLFPLQVSELTRTE